MFSKLSRYRRLPDVVTVDAKGRRLPSKSLRPLPEVSGDFWHTLADSDRLDHLAHRYYRQPRKWWRVCDGNPEFLSPLALLGEEPVVTTHFTVTYIGVDDPWWLLLRDLAGESGVERVMLGIDREAPSVTIVVPMSGDEEEPPQLQVGGEPSLEASPVPQGWHRALADHGLELSERARLEAHEDGWLLLDQGDDGAFKALAFVTQAEVGQAYRRLPIMRRYRWTAAITYDRLNIDLLTLGQKMEALGFDAEPLETVGRIGKQILIPPDTLR